VAAELSRARHEAAERFGAAVTEELAGLAMPHAVVSVDVHAKPAGDGPSIELAGERVAVGPDGVDEVELLLRPHQGAPPLPVQRGASGGELSRVMLAVKQALARTDEVLTYVFDEVDAGVGGGTAEVIGRKLKRLAAERQVIVITHLPQVAAFADAHVRVTKTAARGKTRVAIEPLAEAERPAEIARMLAGATPSAQAAAHAAEMLRNARQS
jgi:DNA repair protein RecN (Recombination protein N)